MSILFCFLNLLQYKKYFTPTKNILTFLKEKSQAMSFLASN